MPAKPKHTDRILAMIRHCAAVERRDLSASKHDRYAVHVTLFATRVGIFRRHVRYGVHDWQYRTTSWFSDPDLAAVAFVEAVGLTRARKAAEALAKRHGFAFPELPATDEAEAALSISG